MNISPENLPYPRGILILIFGISLASSLLILTLGNIIPFLVLTGLVLAVLGLYNYKILVYLFLLTLPFTSQKLPEPYESLTKWGLILFLIGIWLVRKILGGEKIQMVPGWFALLFCGVVTWSVISAINYSFSISSLWITTRMVWFFLFFVLVYDIIDLENFRGVFWYISIPFIIIAMVFLYKAAFSGGIVGLLIFTATKQAWVWGNPNLIGELFLIFIPVFLSIYMFDKNSKHRTYYLIATIILTAGLFISNSRASYLGVFCSAFILILFSKYRLRFFAVLLIAFLLIISNPLGNELIKIILREQGGLSGRDIIWHAAFRLFEHNPVFGVGLGNFNEAVYDFIPLVDYKIMYGWVGHAHNAFLHFSDELGLPGLFFLSFFLYKVVKGSIQTLLKVKIAKNRAIAIGIFAMMVGFIVRLFFESIGFMGSAGPYPEIYFLIVISFIWKINRSYKAAANASQDLNGKYNNAAV